MSKIKKVLRLKYRNQLSNRQIQTMTGVSRNSVANYIKSYIYTKYTLFVSVIKYIGDCI